MTFNVRTEDGGIQPLGVEKRVGVSTGGQENGGLKSGTSYSEACPCWGAAWTEQGFPLHMVPRALDSVSVDLRSRPRSAQSAM